MFRTQKLVILSCLAVVLLAFVACADNTERREKLDVVETLSPTVEQAQQPISTPNASDTTEDEPQSNVEDVGEVETDENEDVNYSAEYIAFREAILGLWHVIDPSGCQWFIGGETVEFFPNGTAIETFGESSWEKTWVLEKINPAIFTLRLINENFQLNYWAEIEDGELLLYEETGLPLIFSRNASQVQQATAPSGDEWVTINNIITIPANWHYDTWSGIEIFGEDVGGTNIHMQVRWADASTIQELWEEAFHTDDVFFDDGSIGVYFMLPDSNAWLNQTSNNVLYLWTDVGDNADIIGRVARSLR